MPTRYRYGCRCCPSCRCCPADDVLSVTATVSGDPIPGRSFSGGEMTRTLGGGPFEGVLSTGGPGDANNTGFSVECAVDPEDAERTIWTLTPEDHAPITVPAGETGTYFDLGGLTIDGTEWPAGAWLRIQHPCDCPAGCCEPPTMTATVAPRCAYPMMPSGFTLTKTGDVWSGGATADCGPPEAGYSITLECIEDVWHWSVNPGGHTGTASPTSCDPFVLSFTYTPAAGECCEGVEQTVTITE